MALFQWLTLSCMLHRWRNHFGTAPSRLRPERGRAPHHPSVGNAGSIEDALDRPSPITICRREPGHEGLRRASMGLASTVTTVAAEITVRRRQWMRGD